MNLVSILAVLGIAFGTVTGPVAADDTSLEANEALRPLRCVVNVEFSRDYFVCTARGHINLTLEYDPAQSVLRAFGPEHSCNECAGGSRCSGYVDVHGEGIGTELSPGERIKLNRQLKPGEKLFLSMALRSQNLIGHREETCLLK